MPYLHRYNITLKFIVAISKTARYLLGRILWRGISDPLLTESINSSDIVVLCIHGTFDADRKDYGNRWWQCGSEFQSILSEEMTILGCNHVTIPFHWTGENSDADRIRASHELVRILRYLRWRRKEVSILAHSHGGNIVSYAFRNGLTILDISPPVNPSSIITFGTPYIYRRRGVLSVFNIIGNLLAFLLCIPLSAGSIITLVLGNVKELPPASAAWLTLILFLVIARTQNAFLRPFAAAKLRKAVAGTIGPVWICVVSAQDEAINTLIRLSKFRPKMGSARRGRNQVIRVARLSFLLVTLLLLIALVLIGVASYWSKLLLFNSIPGLILIIISIILLTSATFVIYILIDFLIGIILLPVSMAFPSIGKQATRATLRSIAFGEDDDYIIYDISDCPQEVSTEVHIFESAIPIEKQKATQTEKLADIYELLILSQASNVSEDNISSHINALKKEFFHGSYFADRTLARRIATRIASGVKSQ